MSKQGNTKIKSLRKIQFSLVGVFLAIIILSVAILNKDSNFLKPKKSVYKSAKDGQKNITNIVYALKETDPLLDFTLEDDAADDPAIWLNKNNPDKSVIYGSNKKAGIHSYNLDGKELQFVKYAKINNIDIRQNAKLGNSYYDILAGSNMSNKTIDIFFIDKNGKLDKTPNFSIILTGFKPYGFCLHKTKTDNIYAFVNDKDGNVNQYFVNFNKDGQFVSELVKSIKLSSQVEGMVADDKNEKVYISEEEVGIHVFSTNNKKDTIGFLLNGSTSDENFVEYDIEGLALLPPHYLVASNQGNFTFSIFNLENNTYVSSFKIANNIIDGVEETDGIEILAHSFNETFPNGLFVVHDGFNYDGNKRKSQNFKMLDLNDLNAFVPQNN